MAVGGGSVGVEEFADDGEAIKAIRLFPGVMRSFAGLGPDATDAQIKGASVGLDPTMFVRHLAC